MLLPSMHLLAYSLCRFGVEFCVIGLRRCATFSGIPDAIFRSLFAGDFVLISFPLSNPLQNKLPAQCQERKTISLSNNGESFGIGHALAVRIPLPMIAHEVSASNRAEWSDHGNILLTMRFSRRRGG
jgi:hypothetical protein